MDDPPLYIDPPLAIEPLDDFFRAREPNLYDKPSPDFLFFFDLLLLLRPLIDLLEESYLLFDLRLSF